MDRKSWVEVLVLDARYEIRDLIPGSDYCVSLQSVLGSDTSAVVHREFSTRKRYSSTHAHIQKHTCEYPGQHFREFCLGKI